MADGAQGVRQDICGGGDLVAGVEGGGEGGKEAVGGDPFGKAEEAFDVALAVEVDKQDGACFSHGFRN